MPPRPADDLVGTGGIACNPTHYGRKILTTLRLEALNEVGAIVLVECGIIPVVTIPDTATRRIDELMDTRNRRAGRKLCESIFALAQDASPWRQARATGCVAGEALCEIRGFLSPCVKFLCLSAP